MTINQAIAMLQEAVACNPGPWWQTGFAGDESYATVVAYFPADQADQLLKYWPEATEVDVQCRDGITFTDRFACPDYWDEANCCVKPEVAAQYPTTALVSGDTQ